MWDDYYLGDGTVIMLASKEVSIQDLPSIINNSSGNYIPPSLNDYSPTANNSSNSDNSSSSATCPSGTETGIITDSNSVDYTVTLDKPYNGSTTEYINKQDANLVGDPTINDHIKITDNIDCSVTVEKIN